MPPHAPPSSRPVASAVVTGYRLGARCGRSRARRRASPLAEGPRRSCYDPTPMDSQARTDLFHGLFELHPGAAGRPRLASSVTAPRAIPDPQTGRPLKVASLELSDRGI